MKTKDQLIDECVELRAQIEELQRKMDSAIRNLWLCAGGAVGLCITAIYWGLSPITHMGAGAVAGGLITAAWLLGKITDQDRERL